MSYKSYKCQGAFERVFMGPFLPIHSLIQVGKYSSFSYFNTFNKITQMSAFIEYGGYSSSSSSTSFVSSFFLIQQSKKNNNKIGS